jgi:hypothetical protein
MNHNEPVHPQGTGPSPKRLAPPRDSELSPPQLEFARLLGRLLAEMWESERSAPATPQSGEDAQNHQK